MAFVKKGAPRYDGFVDGFETQHHYRRRSYYEVKQIDGQNQRIERISPTQLVVGIDMAKETHVAHATNFRGIVVAKRHLTLKNAREGYEKLQRWMDELQQKHRRRPSSSGWNPQDTIGGTWRIGLQTKALIQ
jgi:hypothetical protein